MKKSVKLFTALLLSAACGTGAALISGCVKKQNVTGEYSYTNWGTEYGVKVNVEVQTDKKGDRIRKVTVSDSDLVDASPAMNGWDPTVWEENLQNLLNSYRGQYVVDVLAKEVVTKDDGAPLVKGDKGFVSYGSDVIITGATLGSGRLLLAVQDALQKFGGYKVVEGEYGYANDYGAYGARVRVIVKDEVICRVAVLSSDYTNASEMESGDWKPANWNSQSEAVLKAYEGKTVAEVKAATATVKGQDGASDNSVSDQSILATGATMSSARLLKAVQNALGNL